MVDNKNLRPPPLFREAFFQFNENVFFYSRLKPSGFSGHNSDIIVLKALAFLFEVEVNCRLRSIRIGCFVLLWEVKELTVPSTRFYGVLNNNTICLFMLCKSIDVILEEYMAGFSNFSL